MTAITYTMQANGNNGSFKHTFEDGRTALCAVAHPQRDDDKFCGISISMQASPRFGESGPDAVDTELFYQAVALLGAATDLLSALQDAVEYLKHHLPDEAIAPHLAAIAKATTHPLHDEMEAAEIAYEEQQEMRRAKDAERADRDYDEDGDDRAYLYGDEDTGEDCNVEADHDDGPNPDDAYDLARQDRIDDERIYGARELQADIVEGR